MNINFLLETILMVISLLASNFLIYSLPFLNLNKENFSEQNSFIMNNSEKDTLALP
jgi:hypothetical protein